jgi:hypothetical protein
MASSGWDAAHVHKVVKALVKQAGKKDVKAGEKRKLISSNDSTLQAVIAMKRIPENPRLRPYFVYVLPRCLFFTHLPASLSSAPFPTPL